MNDASPGTAQPSDDHSHDSHGGNTKYWIVFVALCVLTLCSFLTYFDWWNESVPRNTSRAIMMAVSCGKAMLVMLFFMHLLWEASWKWVLTIPASMMAVFLVLMLVPDIGYRTEGYSTERWLHAPELPSYAETNTSHTPAVSH